MQFFENLSNKQLGIVGGAIASLGFAFTSGFGAGLVAFGLVIAAIAFITAIDAA